MFKRSSLSLKRNEMSPSTSSGVGGGMYHRSAASAALAGSNSVWFYTPFLRTLNETVGLVQQLSRT
jgi:hypothetical protein